MIDQATSWFKIVELPRQVITYDNGSEFKLNFETLCDSYGIKRKPTSIKNPQANEILEQMHQVIMTMLCTTELDMANTVAPGDIADFLIDAACAVRSTYTTRYSKTLQEITGNAKPIATLNVKTSLSSIGIIKLVIKYCFAKKVSSANQKANTIKILGLCRQSICRVHRRND
eukprot:CCRYP_011230-RA/>CCRYP_011230-RA protein AED:0.13 eAED:0.53 QI:0/0/0/0.66/0/0/3/0/171